MLRCSTSPHWPAAAELRCCCKSCWASNKRWDAKSAKDCTPHKFNCNSEEKNCNEVLKLEIHDFDSWNCCFRVWTGIGTDIKFSFFRCWLTASWLPQHMAHILHNPFISHLSHNSLFFYEILLGRQGVACDKLMQGTHGYDMRQKGWRCQSLPCCCEVTYGNDTTYHVAEGTCHKNLTRSWKNISSHALALWRESIGHGPSSHHS